jgi:hypothetical protein
MNFDLSFGQSGATQIPQLIEKNGGYTLLVDGEPYLMKFCGFLVEITD